MGFFFSLVRTSIKASISLRGAFLLESALMIGNNFIFLSIWWIFFREFKSVGGWYFDDMIALMAVVTGGYGLQRVFLGGVKELSFSIVSGNLDPYMTQPKNLLIHLLGSKSQSKGWGHMMTSIALYCLGDRTTFGTLPLFLLVILGGCLVFASFGVIVHSLPFWFGRIEMVSKKYVDSLILFLHYPVNIYSGFLKFVMFTFFPAGIIAYLPVELFRGWSWGYFVGFLGGVGVFCGLAFSVFYLGLRRYESGNQFGIRI